VTLTEDEKRVAKILELPEEEILQRKHQLAEERRIYSPHRLGDCIRHVARQMKIPLALVLKRGEQRTEGEES
jgi:hypothetical protein